MTGPILSESLAVAQATAAAYHAFKARQQQQLRDGGADGVIGKDLVLLDDSGNSLQQFQQHHTLPANTEQHFGDGLGGAASMLLAAAMEAEHELAASSACNLPCEPGVLMLMPAPASTLPPSDQSFTTAQATPASFNPYNKHPTQFVKQQGSTGVAMPQRCPSPDDVDQLVMATPNGHTQQSPQRLSRRPLPTPSALSFGGTPAQASSHPPHSAHKPSGTRGADGCRRHQTPSNNRAPARSATVSLPGGVQGGWGGGSSAMRSSTSLLDRYLAPQVAQGLGVHNRRPQQRPLAMSMPGDNPSKTQQNSLNIPEVGHGGPLGHEGSGGWWDSVGSPEGGTSRASSEMDQHHGHEQVQLSHPMQGAMHTATGLGPATQQLHHPQARQMDSSSVHSFDHAPPVTPSGPTMVPDGYHGSARVKAGSQVPATARQSAPTPGGSLSALKAQRMSAAKHRLTSKSLQQHTSTHKQAHPLTTLTAAEKQQSRQQSSELPTVAFQQQASVTASNQAGTGNASSKKHNLRRNRSAQEHRTVAGGSSAGMPVTAQEPHLHSNQQFPHMHHMEQPSQQQQEQQLALVPAQPQEVGEPLPSAEPLLAAQEPGHQDHKRQKRQISLSSQSLSRIVRKASGARPSSTPTFCPQPQAQQKQKQHGQSDAGNRRQTQPGLTAGSGVGPVPMAFVPGFPQWQWPMPGPWGVLPPVQQAPHVQLVNPYILYPPGMGFPTHQEQDRQQAVGAQQAVPQQTLSFVPAPQQSAVGQQLSLQQPRQGTGVMGQHGTMAQEQQACQQGEPPQRLRRPFQDMLHVQAADGAQGLMSVEEGAKQPSQEHQPMQQGSMSAHNEEAEELVMEAAALMHAHYVLHRCLQAWHRVAEEHSTELWIAAQMALTPQQRSCRMVLRGWMRHVHEQQVLRDHQQRVARRARALRVLAAWRSAAVAQRAASDAAAMLLGTARLRHHFLAWRSAAGETKELQRAVLRAWRKAVEARHVDELACRMADTYNVYRLQRMVLRAWVLQWCRAGAVRVFAIKRAQRIAREVLTALAEHAREQQEERGQLEAIAQSFHTSNILSRCLHALRANAATMSVPPQRLQAAAMWRAQRVARASLIGWWEVTSGAVRAEELQLKHLLKLVHKCWGAWRQAAAVAKYHRSRTLAACLHGWAWVTAEATIARDAEAKHRLALLETGTGATQQQQPHNYPQQEGHWQVVQRHEQQGSVQGQAAYPQLHPQPATQAHQSSRPQPSAAAQKAAAARAKTEEALAAASAAINAALKSASAALTAGGTTAIATPQPPVAGMSQEAAQPDTTHAAAPLQQHVLHLQHMSGAGFVDTQAPSPNTVARTAVTAALTAMGHPPNSASQPSRGQFQSGPLAGSQASDAHAVISGLALARAISGEARLQGQKSKEGSVADSDSLLLDYEASFASQAASAQLEEEHTEAPRPTLVRPASSPDLMSPKRYDSAVQDTGAPANPRRLTEGGSLGGAHEQQQAGYPGSGSPYRRSATTGGAPELGGHGSPAGAPGVHAGHHRSRSPSFRFQGGAATPPRTPEAASIPSIAALRDVLNSLQSPGRTMGPPPQVAGLAAAQQRAAAAAAGTQLPATQPAKSPGTGPVVAAATQGQGSGEQARSSLQLLEPGTLIQLLEADVAWFDNMLGEGGALAGGGVNNQGGGDSETGAQARPVHASGTQDAASASQPSSSGSSSRTSTENTGIVDARHGSTRSARKGAARHQSHHRSSILGSPAMQQLQHASYLGNQQDSHSLPRRVTAMPAEVTFESSSDGSTSGREEQQQQRLVPGRLGSAQRSPQAAPGRGGSGSHVARPLVFSSPQADSKVSGAGRNGCAAAWPGQALSSPGLHPQQHSMPQTSLPQCSSWDEQQHIGHQHVSTADTEGDDGAPVYLEDFLQGEPSPEVSRVSDEAGYRSYVVDTAAIMRVKSGSQASLAAQGAVQRTNHDRLRTSGRQVHGHADDDSSDSASWHGGSLQSEHGSESDTSVQDRGRRLDVEDHSSAGTQTRQQQQRLLPAEVALLQQLGADLAAHVGIQPQKQKHPSSPAHLDPYGLAGRPISGSQPQHQEPPSHRHQAPVFLDNPVFAGHRKEARATPAGPHNKQCVQHPLPDLQHSPAQAARHVAQHNQCDTDSSDGSDADDHASSASSSGQLSPATAAAWVRDNPMFEHKAVHGKAGIHSNVGGHAQRLAKHARGSQRTAVVPASPGRPLHEALQDLLTDEC